MKTKIQNHSIGELALEITKNFKVLPYREVEKRLDAKVNYFELDKKYRKGI